MNSNSSLRTSIQLFRDSLRLAQHIAGKNSPKGRQLIQMIRTEFKKNMTELDPVKVDALKGAAIRGLATYLMMESSAKDERFQKNALKFARTEAETLKKDKNEKMD